MESYIDLKKKLYNTIMKFLEKSDENLDVISQKYLKKIYDNFNFDEDREEMIQFLLTIKSISDNHHRDCHFIQKITQIFQHYKEQIKQILSNDEIYQIFESNKLIVLFLLKNEFITISEKIYNEMIIKKEPNGNSYCHFFYPELEKFKGEEKMKNIKKDILSINPTAFEHFEKNRQEGENDSFICSLIRNDLVEEFISYINRNNYSVSRKITPSIFETNQFLISNNNTTLIEYSAFFGSIQIFQYLLLNNAELTESLWLYAIHSKNAELIHLLESNKISPPKFMNNNNSYLKCYIESIKCHHNDFVDYIENNLMIQNETESKQIKEEIISNIIKYHNYKFFQTDTIKEQGFFYLYLYNYKKLVDFLLIEKDKEIKTKIISMTLIL